MNKNNLYAYAVVRHDSIIQQYELTAITSLPTQIVSSASVNHFSTIHAPETTLGVSENPKTYNLVNSAQKNMLTPVPRIRQNIIKSGSDNDLK